MPDSERKEEADKKLEMPHPPEQLGIFAFRMDHRVNVPTHSLRENLLKSLLDCPNQLKDALCNMLNFTIVRLSILSEGYKLLARKEILRSGFSCVALIVARLFLRSAADSD